jgi:luciferase family oxidoreductase group 1
MKLSILDLCPILSNHSPSESFQHTTSLAQFAEGLGYHRYWMAEHHNMAGIGSSAPEVLIAHVASHTKTIRVGSGGIMLPNHATLHMAEIFRTLEALYPGRIDFGLGRAPGSGTKASHALRSVKGLSADDFPDQLTYLMNWMNDEFPAPYMGVEAIPTKVKMPEVWILGSSDFGSMLAGDRGLPYAFAQHFSQLPALEIIRLYREYFRPSKWLSRPHAMLGVHIICAETDEEAYELALSSDLQFSLFVSSGKSIPLPSVEEAKAYGFTEEDWKQVRAGSMPKFIGSPETIKRKLEPFTRSGIVDELMILSMIYDQDKRKKSYELVQDLFK